MDQDASFEVFLRPDQEHDRRRFEAVAKSFYTKLIASQKSSPLILESKLIFVFGGDGTLLSAIQHYGYGGTYLLTKADGTLGHFSVYENVEQLAQASILDDEKVEYEHHGLLELTCDGKKFYAVNEFLISNPFSTIKFEVYIDDILLSPYAASGICLSTPFGSTAYSHSLGGSIIYDNRGFELNLLAPIENKIYYSGIKSLYLDDEHQVDIKILNRSVLSITADMTLLPIDDSVKELHISKIKKGFSLLHLGNFSPSERLNRSFVGNNWSRQSYKE